MDEAVFIAQYTFLATPAVIEEESRILGKIARRLRCEYVIRFEDDGKFYFLAPIVKDFRVRTGRPLANVPEVILVG